MAAISILAACTDTSPQETTAAPATSAAPTTPPTTTAMLPYLDPALPVEDRVEDLLGRMTLDEKIGQMTLVHKDAVSVAAVTELGIGAVLSGGGQAPQPNTPEAWVEMTTSLQDAALATRLGIPMLYGSDAVHGHNNLLNAVIFPHNVGLGAAGSADLVERVARATAVEAAATGVTWNYAPVLAVPRDIRWGRTYESFGESTELVTELGTAYVRGLQGSDLARPDAVLATPKHFVGDGAAEWGTSRTDSYQIDQGDTSISLDELRAVHLAPYLDAIDAGALSVMASYSSFQGTKLHASGDLLSGVLKDELGFAGFVVSDWAAIDQIEPDDYAASVAAAINAGIDMNMVPAAYVDFQRALRAAADSGEVPIERIDDAVRRILRAKVSLGLFEASHPAPDLLESIGAPEHRALAAEAVARSLVLLLNDGTTLPITADTIFVAGSGADDIGLQSGGWTITWQGGVGPITEGSTIVDGVREHAGSDTEVWFDRDGQFDGGAPDRADVGIVVVGERPYAEGAGDDGRLAVEEPQVELVTAMRARVDALVVIVLSGRPLILDDILDSADVVVVAWLPGSEGAAVAGPLFGAEPFSGRLPLSWPRSVGQLPFDGSEEGCAGPLFPFGHGLAIDAAFRPPACDATS